MRNICDGTKMDCITKAYSICKSESTCLGFMWNSGWGSSGYKGVIKCTSLQLTAKPEQDWEIYLKKCNAGIDSTSFQTSFFNIKTLILLMILKRSYIFYCRWIKDYLPNQRFLCISIFSFRREYKPSLFSHDRSCWQIALNLLFFIWNDKTLQLIDGTIFSQKLKF